eukprot:5261315-Lingulodinium_polyedra.AAC.1
MQIVVERNDSESAKKPETGRLPWARNFDRKDRRNTNSQNPSTPTGHGEITTGGLRATQPND